jgi:hypothetical protein
MKILNSAIFAIVTVSTMTIPIAGATAETIGLSTLNLPDCPNTCYKIGVNTFPGGNGIQPNTEFRFSVGISLDRAETDRLAATAKRYQIKQQQTKQAYIDLLQRDLVTAIDLKQYTRARIIAIQLAPRLGYKDYRRYLSTISGGNFPAP